MAAVICGLIQDRPSEPASHNTSIISDVTLSKQGMVISIDIQTSFHSVFTLFEPLKYPFQKSIQEASPKLFYTRKHSNSSY